MDNYEDIETNLFFKLVTGKSFHLIVRYSDNWLYVKQLINESESIPIRKIKLVMK